jgi:hypothetical protein
LIGDQMSIIVAGSASRKALLAGILQYDKLCATSDAATLHESSIKSIDADGQPIIFNLNSKYYDARLKFLIGRDDELDGWKPLLQSSDSEFPVEGIIYVTDSIQMTESTLSESAVTVTSDNQSELDVKLLVHWKSSGSPDLDDAERTSRFEWSLDHGFEFIEIDATNVTHGWENREKEGLPRLIEALHSNMWSTMVRKDPNVQKLPSSSVFTRVEATVAREDRCPVPAVGTGPHSGLGDITASVSPSATASGPNTSLAVKPTDANVDINGDDDEEDKELMGKFEEIIGQARQYRQQAAEGTVSDEERLSRAEHVARALAAMLNITDDDDDED